MRIRQIQQYRVILLLRLQLPVVHWDVRIHVAPVGEEPSLVAVIH